MFQKALKQGLVYTVNNFSPEKLQYFDPRLVVEFIPESLINQPADLQHYLVVIYSLLQLGDLYRALDYAEKEILPNLKKENLSKLTPEKLLDWIKSLHSYTSATLALDTQNAKPGEYVTLPIGRWAKGVLFKDELIAALKKPTGLNELLTKYDLQHLVIPLTKLFKRLKKDDSIAVPNTEIQEVMGQLDPETFRAWLMVQKMAYFTYQNLFSTKEINVISQIVKIGMPPDKISDAMNRFVHELHKALIKCSGKQEEVIKLVSFAFKELTEIHPFFNANGRTATILLNLILGAFNFPSIVFRTQEEAEDPHSTYNRAINLIAKDIGFLEKHIEIKLNTAMKSNIKYIKESLNNRIIQQKDVYDLVSNLLQLNQKNLNNDAFNIDAVYKELLNQVQEKWRNNTKDIKLPVTLTTEVCFEFTSSQQIIKELARITGYSNWKSNKKNGLKIWLTGLNKVESEAVISQLSPYDAMKIRLEKSKGTEDPIVWIEQPSLLRLEKIPPLLYEHSDIALKKI